VYEYGCLWTLVGGDGTTVSFNDGSSGLVVENVTGWDSPNIRTTVVDLPEDDGAIAGKSFLGQRPWTLEGRVGVHLSAAGRNLAVSNLQSAARGLRLDALAKSSPSGLPAMQSACRLVGLRVSAQYLKNFQLQFVSADPRAYSQTLNSQSATGASPAVTCVNAGNFPAPTTITITGPVTNAVITNSTNGDVFYLDTSVASGHTCVIDFLPRTCKDGGTDDYRYIRFPSSVWLALNPGTNALTLTGSGTTGATGLQVQWRDAWV
jgi:hypothetical protein